MKTVPAILAVCLLYACSGTHLTYNYLDWIIDWYLDDYLSLNRRQEDFYEQRLDALLRWHRAEELARYSRFVDQLQQDMGGALTPALLQERYDRLRQFMRDIMERAAPDCAELLLLLDPSQRRIFYAAAANKQRRLEDKHLNETADERNRRHCEKAEKAITRFVGGLTPAQQALIERWAGTLAPTQRLWLENRRAWQDRLQAALEAEGPAAEKRKPLERLFVEPERLWAPAYREAIRQNETATLSMLADLHALLTEKQKKRLQTALNTLKEDLNSLSRQ